MPFGTAFVNIFLLVSKIQIQIVSVSHGKAGGLNSSASWEAGYNGF